MQTTMPLACQTLACEGAVHAGVTNRTGVASLAHPYMLDFTSMEPFELVLGGYLIAAVSPAMCNR
jgi:hypothetical protein